jgi:hypothetical protein
VNGTASSDGCTLGTSPGAGNEWPLLSTFSVAEVEAVLLDMPFELEFVARFIQLGTSRLRILEVLDSPFILTRRATGLDWLVLRFSQVCEV